MLHTWNKHVEVVARLLSAVGVLCFCFSSMSFLKLCHRVVI